MWMALLTLKSSTIVGYTLKLRLKCNLEKWTHPCLQRCCRQQVSEFATAEYRGYFISNRIYVESSDELYRQAAAQGFVITKCS
jgi:hypothetical protein